MEFSVLMDVDASELFEENNGINLQYCQKHATFSHKEACEYILHIGDDGYHHFVAKEMANFGCTESFITTYQNARRLGAMRILLHA